MPKRATSPFVFVSKQDEENVENIAILGESWYFYMHFRPLSMFFLKINVTLRQKEEYAKLNYADSIHASVVLDDLFSH